MTKQIDWNKYELKICAIVADEIKRFSAYSKERLIQELIERETKYWDDEFDNENWEYIDEAFELLPKE